jgi:transmembrane sensor
VDVAKNPDRPFVVEVDGVAVRAIGTAFNVRRMAGALEVLVTEGRVQIETAAPLSGDVRNTNMGSAGAVAEVAPGERARLELGLPAARPAIDTLSPAEIARELEWHSVRLEFDELPLAAVAHEFNLRNAQQLRVADPAIGRLRISGTFRSGQVDGFVRLLEASYGLKAVRDADGAWVLHRVSE